LAIEIRWANNEPERLAELAADLLRHRVAVIALGGGSLTALAAKAATATGWQGDPIQGPFVSWALQVGQAKTERRTSWPLRTAPCLRRHSAHAAVGSLGCGGRQLIEITSGELLRVEVDGELKPTRMQFRHFAGSTKGRITTASTDSHCVTQLRRDRRRGLGCGAKGRAAALGQPSVP
jgi:hypothetical protein